MIHKTEQEVLSHMSQLYTVLLSFCGSLYFFMEKIIDYDRGFIEI